MISFRPVRALTSVALFVAIASVSTLGACGTEEGTACDRIAEACHDKDTGSGKPHDCHEAVEAAGVTEAECAALEVDCLAACE
jgi:hypothetical protein